MIARLDIKNDHLIKGIHLEGLRRLGDPEIFSKKYYAEGIDELIYMDAVASLYGRNSLFHMIKKVSKEVFIPLTAGGGIRTLDDAYEVLRSGADKIAINTAAIKNPQFLKKLSNRFGQQCVVLSIEAKRKSNSWEAYIDNGREHTGLDVLDWVQQAASIGIGEVLLTSVDQEGTLKGYDFDLVKKVSNCVNVPVMASGGYGCVEDSSNVILKAQADAVVIAHHLHYEKSSIKEVKSYLKSKGLDIR